MYRIICSIIYMVSCNLQVDVARAFFFQETQFQLVKSGVLTCDSRPRFLGLVRLCASLEQMHPEGK